MESTLLEELKSKSALANETIKRLKSKIDELKKNPNSKIESEDQVAKKLQEENKKLKEQVEILKKQLTDLDSKNPKLHSIPTSTPVVKSEKPAEQTSKSTENATSTAKAPKESKAKTPKKDENVVPANIDISSLDLRVGKIIKCEKHPEADKLYVEQIDLGEDRPRTVCSGLVNHIPLDQMQDRFVALVCNLKPAKLKGILSEAMVLCASTPEKYELLIPPPGAQVGDRITCQGYSGEPVAEINKKNNAWDLVQPDLKTNDNLVATYKGIALEVKSKGALTTASLKNVGIK